MQGLVVGLVEDSIDSRDLYHEARARLTEMTTEEISYSDCLLLADALDSQAREIKILRSRVEGKRNENS